MCARHDVWGRILAAIRDGSLPPRCRAANPPACEAVCYLLANDEEGWRLKQAIFESLDPSNEEGWRHSRPGPHTRWETVFLQLSGERWKERMLSGDFRTSEEDFMGVAMQAVGRIRRPGAGTGQGVADFRAPHETGATPRLAAPLCGRQGISRRGLCFAPATADPALLRIELCMDCDNIVRWVNGTWK